MLMIDNFRATERATRKGRALFCLAMPYAVLRGLTQPLMKTLIVSLGLNRFDRNACVEI